MRKTECLRCSWLTLLAQNIHCSWCWKLLRQSWKQLWLRILLIAMDLVYACGKKLKNSMSVNHRASLANLRDGGIVKYPSSSYSTILDIVATRIWRKFCWCGMTSAHISQAMLSPLLRNWTPFLKKFRQRSHGLANLQTSRGWSPWRWHCESGGCSIFAMKLDATRTALSTFGVRIALISWTGSTRHGKAFPRKWSSTAFRNVEWFKAIQISTRLPSRKMSCSRQMKVKIDWKSQYIMHLLKMRFWAKHVEETNCVLDTRAGIRLSNIVD